MNSFLNPTHRIRDPIYGYIWLTDDELKIVDTPVFQRLRRIGQLALTKYVYPTAEHSRFVHSLGTLQAATNIFNEVLRFNPQLRDSGDLDLKENIKILRFAALLHDIGHMPFSHAAEAIFLNENVSHEDIGKFIIRHHKEVPEIIEDSGIEPQLVASLLKGKRTKKYDFLKKFISGEFDADRADFLLRDSYFCGVKYGEYDYLRYAGAFRLISDENGQSLFTIEKGNLHAVEAFLIARYHYYLQVPFHRTRRGYDLVLERYFQDLRERDKLPETGVNVSPTGFEIDMTRFELVDDYTIFEQIKEDMVQGNQWARILMRQDRLHPIFDTEMDSGDNATNFFDLQVELENDGLKEGEDFFVFSRKIYVHKIVEKSDEKGEHTYPIVDKKQDHKIIGTILDYSSILNASIRSPAHVRRVYVTTHAQPRADKALSRIKTKMEAREKKRKGENI